MRGEQVSPAGLGFLVMGSLQVALGKGVAGLATELNGVRRERPSRIRHPRRAGEQIALIRGTVAGTVCPAFALALLIVKIAKLLRRSNFALGVEGRRHLAAAGQTVRLAGSGRNDFCVRASQD